MADEILVADAGSTDGTLDRVRAFGGCRIIARDGDCDESFESWAAGAARHPWILRVLPHERLSPELGRQVRRAFIAPHGSKLISADYSQVELRILAHVAHDPAMLEAFARGQDIHAATAARLFNVPLDQVTSEMRRRGKTLNFGIVYGITDYGISARTDMSQAEARQLIDNYFTQFAQVKAYLEQTKRQARERGYVQTLLGRRRDFPELQNKGRVNPALKNAAEREAINHPIQGSAADIIKLAMIRLHRELHARNLQSRMTLQVHDELVLECPDAEVRVVAPLVREIMENAYPLESKLKVDVAVGQNWDAMQAVDDVASR